MTACIVILDHEVGIINLVPGTYSNGWSTSTRVCCSGNPTKVELNYRAGVSELPDLAETAIVRLAHSKLPTEPCGCDVIHRLWQRDSFVPRVLTRERINCPFGLSDGAWMAWNFATDIKQYRMGIFA